MSWEEVRGALAPLTVVVALVVAATAPAMAQQRPRRSHAPSSSSSPTPTPSASPSPTSSPTPTPSKSSSPTPAEETPKPSSLREPTPAPTSTGSPLPTPTPGDGDIPPPLTPSAYGYGPYDNSALVALAERLRSFGRSEQYVRKHAYAPFIIVGAARWENSWGALRHDPDGTWRRHLGQDVSCNYGAPVLAAEPGEIEFGTDRLGGLVARLHRDHGGYFYYAHLSDWNDARFSSGDRVSVGDIIGFCGDSGNAEGSTPHVHFGFYVGGAQDPMGFLLRWHDQAKRRAGKILRGLIGSADVSQFARLFGEELVSKLVVVPAVDVPGGPVEVLLDAVLGSDRQMTTEESCPSRGSTSATLERSGSVRYMAHDYCR